MISIQFNKYNFKISQKEEITYIFDEVRKKNVILTPEEWVRQNFIHYLIYDLHYSKGKIAAEKEFKLNGVKKRLDLLVFDKKTQPFLLLECKAQSENLNEIVLTQCLNYNMKFAVPYIFISNGDYTFGWENLNNRMTVLKQFPEYV